MGKLRCMCKNHGTYIKHRKAHWCSKCKRWKERPYVSGADEQFVLFHAERTLKYDELGRVGSFAYKAEMVLDRLEWKKHPDTKFSKKRKEKIELIKKAKKRRKELWRIKLKKKPNKDF